MSDQEPVCAYVAESNSDAHLIPTFLNDHGIKAHADEDNSPAGMLSPEALICFGVARVPFSGSK